MDNPLRDAAHILGSGPLSNFEYEEGFGEPPQMEEWRISWLLTAADVLDFVTSNDRFPGRTDPLGMWLASNQDLRAPSKSGLRRILNDWLPGWDDLKPKWLSRLDEAAAFVAVHGRNPDPRSSDHIEHRIGRWVERERIAGRRADYSVRRASELDRLVPEWRITKLDSRWSAQHKVVVDHYEAHGALPTAADNQRAADWIEKQAERLPAAAAGRRAAADALTPGLASGVAESKWIATSIEVAEFAAENDRLPSRKAKADVERLLGAWLHNQRIRLRGDAPRVQARAKALDVLVDGWRGVGPTGVTA